MTRIPIELQPIVCGWSDCIADHQRAGLGALAKLHGYSDHGTITADRDCVRVEPKQQGFWARLAAYVFRLRDGMVVFGEESISSDAVAARHYVILSSLLGKTQSRKVARKEDYLAANGWQFQKLPRLTWYAQPGLLGERKDWVRPLSGAIFPGASTSAGETKCRPSAAGVLLGIFGMVGSRYYFSPWTEDKSSKAYVVSLIPDQDDLLVWSQQTLPAPTSNADLVAPSLRVAIECCRRSTGVTILGGNAYKSVSWNRYGAVRCEVEAAN